MEMHCAGHAVEQHEAPAEHGVQGARPVRGLAQVARPACLGQPVQVGRQPQFLVVLGPSVAVVPVGVRAVERVRGQPGA